MMMMRLKKVAKPSPLSPPSSPSTRRRDRSHVCHPTFSLAAHTLTNIPKPAGHLKLATMMHFSSLLILPSQLHLIDAHRLAHLHRPCALLQWILIPTRSLLLIAMLKSVKRLERASARHRRQRRRDRPLKRIPAMPEEAIIPFSLLLSRGSRTRRTRRRTPRAPTAFYWISKMWVS